VTIPPRRTSKVDSTATTGGDLIGREDDANGKWNYEVVVRTNGKESAFEVDPSGKFLKKHTEIKR
jgi:hypothetical protein